MCFPVNFAKFSRTSSFKTPLVAASLSIKIEGHDRHRGVARTLNQFYIKLFISIPPENVKKPLAIEFRILFHCPNH